MAADFLTVFGLCRDVVDAETLDLAEALEGPVVIAAALKFSGTRLIDNIELVPHSETP